MKYFDIKINLTLVILILMLAFGCDIRVNDCTYSYGCSSVASYSVEYYCQK